MLTTLSGQLLWRSFCTGEIECTLPSQKKPEQTSDFQTLNRYINSNRVMSMEPGYFDNLASTLLVLKLNRNRITAIPPKMFKLPQLQHLYVRMVSWMSCSHFYTFGVCILMSTVG